MKIIVGYGSCGIAAGANKVFDALELGIEEQKLKADLQIAGCNGMCYLEPIVDVIDNDGNKQTYVKVTPERINEILNDVKDTDLKITEEELLERSNQFRIVTEKCGTINPEDINEYIEIGGYKAIEKCIAEMTQEEVIEEMKISGLRGRGGAGFPTWFKWNAALQSKATPKYMVCNADEGDPGAFMDRSVLEGDPHNLIEGMMIGAYAIGAEEGIVYVRAEYPLAIIRLQNAIEQARQKGLLGKNLFNSNFSFDLRIKAGAGAFVCGEETALIASLEGERGMPRLKPPFPAQKGYWDQPTNINNVETFANIPWIILNGGNKYSELGTEKSKGSKVFALTGKVKNGGLVEVPMGMPIKDIIFGLGGGILEDKEFKAVQMGGPSGGCIPSDLIETTVDYESLAKTGAIMGSGGMVVMDETTCMVDMARFFLDFTRNESCGKCIHCRIGTKRMLEILTRITEGDGKDGDIELLEDLAVQIKDGSLCGLGQTAPNPVLSTIRYFREEYERHIYDKKCPSKQCASLLTYEITDNCIGCGVCKRKCPVEAISGEKKTIHILDQATCIKCGKCYDACKFDAITVD
ncbi:NADH-quinone oxidoreductase subunit F [Alkalibaculum sp. M08DMB]|uniref:NADH-quinone oxidoreductase subunit F n=1 Tax=Alkalibaculum sporogenes TaxID=2655001 RepID=A0A6A7K6G1_9FIRM|nr:NADH-quinone oxidoreductase subunit NuoF [Alkalibaculum sporogenes]MPW25069.1 NADH-quinone oxidoreductase subunit F [Alkalibaculum sporogenes]